MATTVARAVPSYTRVHEVDVFISYGHIDNQENWVTNFHRRLQTRLQELLGTSEISIWRDLSLTGTDSFEDLIEAKVTHAAIFISVLSPRYVASSSCRKELDLFVAAAESAGGLKIDTQSRLIRVVKTRLMEGTEPPNFKSTLGYEFYETDRQNPEVFREFGAELGKARYDQFEERCDLLAQAVARALIKIRQLAPPVQTNARTVFLARTTKDMALFRASISSELTERGHIVLPMENLPDSGPELKTALEDLINKADISIHLMGRSYGVIPEEESRSLGELQYELVSSQRARANFHQLVWIPEDLQAAEERQSRFLSSVREHTGLNAPTKVDVFETCFESFKEGLLDVVSRKPERPALPPGAKAKAVYLVCDQSDLKRKELMSIQAYLRSRGHPVELPPFQGEPEELREAEEELIGDTDAALIYYGSAKDLWVLRKRKNLLKVLSKKQTGRAYARALYLCVPKDDSKAGNYLSVSGHTFLEGDGFCPLLVLGDCEDFRTEKLDAFIDVLERGPAC